MPILVNVNQIGNHLGSNGFLMGLAGGVGD